MKSDKTEMVLLGAAAAVIALVVAFSMMDDKGSRKRSLEEITEEVEEEVGEKVEELKDAAAAATSNLGKVQKLAEDLKSKVPPGSKTERVINAVQGGVSKVTPAVKSVAALIPQDVKDEAKVAVREKAKELGGRAWSSLKEAAGKSFEDNKGGLGVFANLFSKPKPYVAPPGVGVGTRD